MEERRRALLFGIDKYDKFNALTACVKDAREMAKLLEEHGTIPPGSNYSCTTHAGTLKGAPIVRENFRKACREFFSGARSNDSILFFFAGHGVITETDGYFCTADATEDDWGVPMMEIVGFANMSPAREVVLILDCCHSGELGNPSLLKGGSGYSLAAIREGMTVLAASRPVEKAFEEEGRGLFSGALRTALSGAAADQEGWVSAAAAYGFARRRFDGEEQKPTYKSHASAVTMLRRCAPLLDRGQLEALFVEFGDADTKPRLDPHHEPEDRTGTKHEQQDPVKLAFGRLLKTMRNAGVIRTSMEGEDLFWAAQDCHTVELTPLGREYHWLCRNGKL